MECYSSMERDFLKEKFDIAYLISGHVGGKLDESERILLEEWINEKPENQELFNRLTAKENFSDWLTYIESVEKEQAWREALAKSATLKLNRDRLRYRKLAIRLSQVAALFLLILAGTYFLTQLKEVELLPPHFETTYETQLLLHTGKVVNLEEKGEIEVENGVTLLNRADELDLRTISKRQQLADNKLNEVKVSFGKRYIITLSDGSKVYLNSLSKLRFPTQFTKEERRVYLEGEGYFEIAEDKNAPFIVHSGGFDVVVTGTQFNISSYHDDLFFHTTLVTGGVTVRDSLHREVTLTPSQQLLFNREENSIHTREVDLSYYTSWREGVLRFREIKLFDLMKIVQREYNVKVVFEEAEIGDLLFGCNINKSDSIEPILRVIEANGKLKTEIKNETVFIKKSKI